MIDAAMIIYAAVAAVAVLQVAQPPRQNHGEAEAGWSRPVCLLPVYLFPRASPTIHLLVTVVYFQANARLTSTQQPGAAYTAL